MTVDIRGPDPIPVADQKDRGLWERHCVFLCLPRVEGEDSMKVFNAFPLFCVLLHAFQAKGRVN